VVLDVVNEVIEASVGPDDNVFEAGATSITAIKLAHRLTELGGTKINAMQIMQAGTARELAGIVGTGDAARSARRSPGRWLSGLPVPQWRFWYLEAKNPGTDDSRCPLEFRLHGRLDADVLGSALRVVIGWHEALRTRLVRVGRRDVRTDVLPADRVPDVLTVHRASTEDEARHLVAELLAQPFDLPVEIPVRARLVSLGETEHIVVLSVHHTAFDGWSANLICDDLSVAYQAIAAGVPLGDRAPSRFEETWLDQDLRETGQDRVDLDEWSRELLGVPDLPLVEEGTLAPVGPVGEVWIDVPPGLRAAAEQTAASSGGTVPAVLLAAWVRALRRFTGADDFAVGIPVAGRTTPAAQAVVGCFASAVAVRFRGDGDADPQTDLRAATHQLAQALRFQFMPIERLLRESEPRDRSRNPFCQAGFVAQNNVAPTLELGGASGGEVRHLRDTSSFELTLELWQGAAIDARIWYRSDVISAQRADELAALWRAELSAVTTQRAALVA
jgi:hypothetical protein